MTGSQHSTIPEIFSKDWCICKIIINQEFGPCDTCYGSFYVTGNQCTEYWCTLYIHLQTVDSGRSFPVTEEGWNKILINKNWKSTAFWPCDTRYGSFKVTGNQRTEYWCISICKLSILAVWHTLRCFPVTGSQLSRNPWMVPKDWCISRIIKSRIWAMWHMLR